MSTLAEQHVGPLYAISNLLLRTGDVGGSFGQIVDLIGKEFPVRGACLAVEGRERPTAVVVEDPADPVEHRMAAREHAREAFEYLTTRGAVPPHEMTVVPKTRRAVSQGPERAVWVVMPLVLEHQSVFGVIQLEMAERADETALLFISTLAQQLALVIDRHLTVESKVAEADDRAAFQSARRDAANLQRDAAETLRERFTALVDDLDQAFVWECDASSLALRYVSARASYYLGGDRHAWVLCGASLVDLTLPADREALSSALRRARDGHPQRIDHRCLSADGRELWFHTNVHLAERSAPARLQGVTFDVTAAKEAESALRDQLEFTRAVTGSLGEGVIVADRQGRVTSVNAAACRLLGIAPAVLLGRRFRSVVGMHAPNGTFIPDGECPLTRTGHEGAAFAEDDVGFVCGETAFAASFTCTPLRTREKLSGAVMVFRNMSPLKRAERSQRLLAELSAALGGTLERTTAIRRLVGYAARTICDVAIFESLGEAGATDTVEGARRDGLPIDAADLLSGVAPEERAKVLAGREPVLLRVGRSASVPHPSGFFSSAGIDSLVMLPLYARDRPIGVLSLYGWEDHYKEQPDRELLAELARRAAIAIDNAQLHENAEHARRVRDDMLAVVSHDLKNPVSAILLYTDTMLRSHDVSTIEDGLQRIRRSADKMTRLIRDLLDVASIEAGKFAIERRPVAITSVISDALEPLRAVAAKKGVELESIFADGLPVASIDPHRFDQVIANLVGNAIKFTPPGGIVQIKAERSPIGVRFSVLDTGPGIPRADLGNVFDRFWQARKTARLGTGLGLFIARTIVEAHGGSIHVDSKEGIGTIFWFDIATGVGERTRMSRAPAAALEAALSPGVAEIEALSERTPAAKGRA